MCRRDRVSQRLFLSAKNQEGMRIALFFFLLGALGVEEGIKPCAGGTWFPTTVPPANNKKCITFCDAFFAWRAWRDSNPRPTGS